MRPHAIEVLLALGLIVLNGCAAHSARGPEAVGEEARRVMEELEVAIGSGDAETLLARYSEDGVYLAMKGRTTLVPFDDFVRSYREGVDPPHSFEWQDLSYEVLSRDAVVVIGTFQLKWLENEGVQGNE